MTLTRKIFSALAAVIAVGLLSLAITLSHDAPCGVAPALPDDTQVTKAVVYRCYGSPDVLKVENVPKPVPADNEVLVKVRAASLNPYDWHYMTGTSYIMRLDAGVGRPTSPRLGVDFALLAYRGVTTPKGVYIMIGGPKTNKLTGPLGKAAAAYMLAPFISQELTLHLSTAKPDDMTILRDLMQSGKVTPVIDRKCAFDEVPEAMRYLAEGHARGKVILTL